ncbi:hypothetical protein [Yersinia artesiana]|nr:hypothetical protein [Yersinia artesiana]
MLMLFVLLPLTAPAFACMHQGSACYKNCRAAFPDNPVGEFFCDLGGTPPLPHSVAYLQHKELTGYEMEKVVDNFTKTQPVLQTMDLWSDRLTNQS